MQEILGDIGGIIRFSGGAKGGSVVANIVQRGGGGYVKLTANEGGIIGTLQSLGSSGDFFVTKPTSYKPPSPSPPPLPLIG